MQVQAPVTSKQDARHLFDRRRNTETFYRYDSLDHINRIALLLLSPIVETTFNSRTQLHLHQDAHLITSHGSLASSAGHRRHDLLHNNDHLDRDADEDHYRLKSSRCHLNLRKLHELHDRNERNILSVSVREPDTHPSIQLHGRSIKSEWHVRRRRKRPGYDRCRTVVTHEFHDGLAMTGC